MHGLSKECWTIAALSDWEPTFHHSRLLPVLTYFVHLREWKVRYVHSQNSLYPILGLKWKDSEYVRKSNLVEKLQCRCFNPVFCIYFCCVRGILKDVASWSANETMADYWKLMPILLFFSSFIIIIKKSFDTHITLWHVVMFFLNSFIKKRK